MKFYINYFFYFFLSFVLFTTIGTLSHEFGHIAVAKYYGYKTSLHYGSMNYKTNFEVELIKLYKKYKFDPNKSIPYELEKEHNKLIEKYKKESLYVSMGGPLQTMITGLFGCLLLYIRRNKQIESGFNLIDWIAVFLSLFWLRELFNLISSLAYGMMLQHGKYFGGDEYRISKKLNLWEGTIPVVLGLLGLVISLIVVFKIVPFNLRFTFIISGLIGGITGLYLWMDVFGPWLLP